jgi:hypothetical protein
LLHYFEPFSRFAPLAEVALQENGSFPAWEEYKQLDWRGMKEMMPLPYLLDTRNFLPGEYLESLGFKYEGIGLGTRRPSRDVEAFVQS